jgi:hypothetical protein
MRAAAAAGSLAANWREPTWYLVPSVVAVMAPSGTKMCRPGW